MSGRAQSVIIGLALVLLVGCAGSVTPDVTPTPSSSAPSSDGPTARVPSDGVTLAELGFQNGPTRLFSIPRAAIFVTAVDQPNVVTLVLSSPEPRVVGRYLRAALPLAGFTVSEEGPTSDTFTFTGNGWSGGFTASGSRSAIRLSPM